MRALDKSVVVLLSSRDLSASRERGGAGETTPYFGGGRKARKGRSEMMKRTFLSALLGLSILAAGAATLGTADNPSATGVQAQGKSNIKPHAPDRVIVKFKNGIEVDLGLQKIKHFHLIKASVFKVPAGEKAAAFVERLSSDPHVQYAELDFEQQAFVIPNDTRFSELWGLHTTGQSGGTADADIAAPEAWGRAAGTGE